DGEEQRGPQSLLLWISSAHRWRQVLSEAARIKDKHLLTLEPGISENQTREMKANRLQLVIPKNLHTTYRPAQKEWLWNLQDFLQMVKG
ncbi:MAG: type II restriction endonuclease, partial [Nitrospinales bacterium]